MNKKLRRLLGRSRRDQNSSPNSDSKKRSEASLGHLLSQRSNATPNYYFQNNKSSGELLNEDENDKLKKDELIVNTNTCEIEENTEQVIELTLNPMTDDVSPPKQLKTAENIQVEIRGTQEEKSLLQENDEDLQTDQSNFSVLKCKEATPKLNTVAANVSTNGHHNFEMNTASSHSELYNTTPPAINGKALMQDRKYQTNEGNHKRALESQPVKILTNEFPNRTSLNRGVGLTSSSCTTTNNSDPFVPTTQHVLLQTDSENFPLTTASQQVKVFPHTPDAVVALDIPISSPQIQHEKIQQSCTVTRSELPAETNNGTSSHALQKHTLLTRKNLCQENGCCSVPPFQRLQTSFRTMECEHGAIHPSCLNLNECNRRLPPIRHGFDSSTFSCHCLADNHRCVENFQNHHHHTACPSKAAQNTRSCSAGLKLPDFTGQSTCHSKSTCMSLVVQSDSCQSRCGCQHNCLHNHNVCSMQGKVPCSKRCQRHLEEVTPCAFAHQKLFNCNEHCCSTSNHQRQAMAPSVAILSCAHDSETSSTSSHRSCLNIGSMQGHDRHHTCVTNHQIAPRDGFQIRTTSYPTSDQYAVKEVETDNEKIPSNSWTSAVPFHLSPRAFAKLIAFCHTRKLFMGTYPRELNNRFFSSFDNHSNSLQIRNSNHKAGHLGGNFHQSTQLSYENHSAEEFCKLGQVFETVEECPWYWGDISGDQAKKVLQGAPMGTFILRDSSDPGYLYSLSVMTQRGPTSIRIVYSNGAYRFDSDRSEENNSRRLAAPSSLATKSRHRRCVVHMILHYTRYLTERKDSLNENGWSSIPAQDEFSQSRAAVSSSLHSNSRFTNFNPQSRQLFDEEQRRNGNVPSTGSEFMCFWMVRGGRKEIAVLIAKPRVNKLPSLQHLSRAYLSKHLSLWKQPEKAYQLPLPMSLKSYIAKYPYPV